MQPGQPNGLYSQTFSGINAANRVIYQLASGVVPVDAATKTSTTAELRALRAYYYSILLDNFGNVPIVTDFTSTDVPSQSRMGTNTMIHLVDGQWHQTSVQSNTLSYAQRSFPRDVTVARDGGPLSDLLDGLGASRVLSLDVAKDAQLVLNLPRPLTTFG